MWYAAQAPSEDTIVAPSGLRGVHSLPNAAHSCGLIRPWSTSPERHNGDSLVWMSVTAKRYSASKSAYRSESFHPLCGIIPMPRQVRSITSKTSRNIAIAGRLPSSVTARE